VNYFTPKYPIEKKMFLSIGIVVANSIIVLVLKCLQFFSVFDLNPDTCGLAQHTQIIFYE